MTISYQWLSQYIDLPESPEEIGKTLTDTGLEVESIHSFESVKGGLKGLVIGEVLTCSKHPNADKLSITTVDVGQPKPLQIVCGASNVAAGQKVVVALTGTTVNPTKGDSFTIKSAKIRGEQSEGMICAEDEIGLGESHAGIIVLNTSVPNGTLASDFYKVTSDSIIEIGLTPNRAEAASHIGVARDIKAAKGRDIKWPSVDAFKVESKSLIIDVAVENTIACPRFSGVTISGVTIKESPEWLKSRLRSIGLTSINNIVDITNFVLHELGQPLHAYDADKVAGNKIIVKTQPAGTKFITLDNKERSLIANDLMVCNAEEGMCIAGVFGGAKSGISEKTKAIFLEAACFSADYVRKTSNHHQLKTDASFRFSRGTDPLNTVYAVKRAALLIKEIAGGTISSDIIDIYPVKIENRQISVKDKNVNRLIGKVIPREEIFAILKGLDIELINKTADSYTVSVPPYRVDVIQEADIVEEILRIYGFNKIELVEAAGTDFLAHFPDQNINKFKRNIGEILVGNGFFELLTNSLTNIAYQQKHSLQFQGEPVEVVNKLSEEQGILRQTMLFTGLEAVAYNFNRKQKEVKFYEFGKIYYKDNNQYIEQERLAVYLGGNIESENWQSKPRLVTYHDLAQQVVQILEKCAAGEIVQLKIEDPLYDYCMSFSHKQKEIGRIGKVKSALAKDFGIRQEIFYADMDTHLLFQSANPKFDVQEVPKFPEVKRDLSLVLDKSVSFEEIRKMVIATEKKLMKEVTVFDVYEGENIPAGKKAYSVGFTLLDETKTLTDEEIDKTMTRLMTELEKKLGAIIRK
ncbi:MAG: phenylalanine--tRNA ligase subunit beta [Cyclobacteriaceae bacterium]|nr:phenylalanine--tRNA ligase subunit beta [Cyclobacteriaceae bacterium]